MYRSNTDTLAPARTQAVEFVGLPGRVGRYEIVNALEEVGSQLGFNGTHIRYLRLMVGYTRESDWRGGESEPFVWMGVEEIAYKLGISPRHINRIEKKLVELGAIHMKDYGNFHRRGYRDGKGIVRKAFGVDLRPLASLWEIVWPCFETAKKNGREWKETRLETSFLRRRIGDTLRSGNPAIDETSIEEIASSEAFTCRIRRTMPLERLKAIHDTLLSYLEKLEKMIVDDVPEETPLHGKMSQKASQNVVEGMTKCPTPYKYNNDNNIDKSRDVDKNANEDIEDEEEKLRSLREQPLFDPQPQQPQPPTQRRDSNAMSLGSFFDKSPFADRKKTAKEKKTGSRRASLSLEKVVASSPKVFREAMHRPDAPIIEDVVLACNEVAPLLGMSFKQRDELWRVTREQLGIRDACMLWIVTLSRHLEGEIESPVGFLLGMLEKDRQGQLDLNASLLGMIKRATGVVEKKD